MDEDTLEPTHIRFLISTAYNVPGEKVKILYQDETDIYYNDAMGRYCYIEKELLGTEFEYVPRRKSRKTV